jgi:hypothetical protein
MADGSRRRPARAAVVGVGDQNLGVPRVIQVHPGAIEPSAVPPARPYFRNYAALPYEWRLDLAQVDDEPVIVHWQKRGDEWVPLAAVRLWWREGKVSRIRDYVQVEYLFRYSRTEPVPI